MSGSQQLLLGGAAAAAPAVDPFFYSVTSLLHGDGTNGAQNNTFLDSSTNNFTITRNGNTTQGSFSPFSQTGWGNYFDGTGDYLTIADNTALDMGSSNFTIEGWYFPLGNAAVSTALFSKRADSSGVGGVLLYYGGTGLTPSLLVDIGGSWAINSASSVAFVANQWNHFAVVRNGSAFNLYINGVSGVSATNAGSIPDNSSAFTIGATGANGAFPISACYMSNFRVVKGTAVYTAAFTVPTTPLTAITNTSLLTCQANRFLDASSNAFAITRNGDVSVQPFSPFNPTTAYSTSAVGGSGYFDGSGDYLETTSSQIIPSGNFTIEAWAYITSSSSTQTIVAQGTGVGDGARTWMGIENSSGAKWAVQVGGTQAISSVTPVLNAWHYLAMVYNGSTIKMYLNGTEIASASSTTNASNTTLKIGTNWGSYITTGFISNIRISNTARTISAVPSSLLTTDANTVFLANFTNAGIFDNAADADYETVGNAQISTSVKKYGTGSMAFDGTGDYLTSSPNQSTLCAFGTGDFTIEFWIYLNTVSGNQATVDLRPSGVNGAYPLIYVSSTSLTYYVSSASQINGGVLAASTWYHVAISRVASQTKMFLNGTQVGSTYADTNSYLCGSGAPWVGSFRDGTGQLNGYVDDLRISKGVGRYPYNFTPPTAEFPNIGGTVTLTADPYYEYTTLLLPGNGTNGAQNNTFLDSSTNAFSITRNGNTTQGTFSPFSQTGWGVYFNGSSDYISVADSADFTMGSGDFTIQCWVYSTANSGSDQYILGQVPSTGAAASTSFQLYKKATTNVAECYVYIGGAKVATSTATIPVGQWTHLAMVRDGGTMRLYVNGSQDGTNATLSTSSIVDSTGSFSVGRTGDYNGLYFAGYVSNVSVVKGTCLFPNGTTFTPSTTPLSTSTSGQSVLLCQANRFIDTNTATTAKTVTVGSTSSIQAFSPFNPTAAWSAATYGGSGYFDGSGDYLTVADNAAFDFGTGDFTWEAWVYPTTAQAMDFYVHGGNTSTTFEVYISSGGTLYLINNAAIITSSSNVVFRQWNHLAIARSGTSLKMFINGAEVGSVTNSTNFTNSGSVYIGAYSDGIANPTAGYMFNLRVVKGTAVYTAAFTPPTAPLTAISGTSLLCNFTNAGIYDATSKNDLETVGNAQISTTQSKFGGSSMYFDGTGDYLSIPATQNIVFGTADFTIEMWVYSGSQGSTGVRMFGNGAGAAWSSGKYILTTTTAANPNKFTLGINNASPADVLVSTTTFNDSTWKHVAITRYNGVFRLFVNGILESTNTTNVSVDNGTAAQIRIGSSGISGDADWAGYIDDLRITKGIARYTSNFSVPTAAFPVL